MFSAERIFVLLKSGCMTFVLKNWSYLLIFYKNLNEITVKKIDFLFWAKHNLSKDISLFTAHISRNINMCIFPELWNTSICWEFLTKYFRSRTKFIKLRRSRRLLYLNNNSPPSRTSLIRSNLTSKCPSSRSTWWNWFRSMIYSGEKEKNWYNCWKETIASLASEEKWTNIT